MIVSLFFLLFTLFILLHTGAVWSAWIMGTPKHTSAVVLFFKGILVATILAALASLFVPISVEFRFALLGILLALTLVKRLQISAIYKDLYHLRHKFTRLDLVFASALIFVLAYASASEITLYDTGLYHTQAIKWIQEYAVVPGLGNLHGRFAFNSHFFVLSALFTFELQRGTETILMYPLNAAGVFVLVCFLYFSVRSFWLAKNYALSIAALLSFIMFLGLYPSWINSPSPDIFCAVGVVFLLFYFLRQTEWERGNLLFLTALMGVLITYKLSNALLILLLVPAFWQYVQKNKLDFPKFAMPFLALVLLIGLPFLARNVALSGYAVYPFPQIDVFDVDWKIPVETVAYEKTHIESWAKVPRGDAKEVAQMQLSEWFPLWWARKSMPFKALLALNVFSLFGFATLFLQKNKKAIIVFAIVWANLLLAFFTAPDPRFVHGFLIFGMALGLGSVVHFFLEKRLTHSTTKYLAPVGIAMTVAGFFTVRAALENMFSQHLFYANAMATADLQNVEKPFPHSVPVGDIRCYNAELMCLPEKVTTVFMRGDAISEGFSAQVK